MRHALLTFTALAGMGLGLAMPLQAQTVPIETRVERMEKELRAVQRKVFPGGVPVQPDMTASTASAPAVPSSTPVADLIARVDAMEAQMASMTGSMEQTSFKLRQLEDSFAKYKAEMEARLGPAPAAMTATPAAAVTPAPASIAPAPVAAKPVAVAPKPVAAAPVASAKPASAPAPVKPAPASDARKQAVAAIERPVTDNPADDNYSYGYRLWAAKFYPEAQVQLKSTLDKYGTTNIGSRAANLLGRAYLDDGKPALASVAFYENYQKRPRGDRAADSLAWLGEALLQLKKPADACKVYSQLETEYGTSLSDTLRTMMEKGRVRGKCPA